MKKISFYKKLMQFQTYLILLPHFKTFERIRLDELKRCVDHLLAKGHGITKIELDGFEVVLAEAIAALSLNYSSIAYQLKLRGAEMLRSIQPSQDDSYTDETIN